VVFQLDHGLKPGYYSGEKEGVQWNPVNTTTFGPWKIGRVNGVVALKGFFK